ncbi:MAG: glutamate 5-kinase [Pseudomonadales bacterium]
MSDKRADLRRAQRIVIKIGSSLLTDQQQGLAVAKIRDYAAAIATQRHAGKEIVLVSSGAVAEGCVRLGWQQRPIAVHQLQAAAAVGQIGLAHAYEESLAAHDCTTAMVMLTHEDLADRQRYLNARATLNQLVELGVVPVINENDTVATDEIRFGDNDTLAALVTNLIEADLLIILTDVDGLMDQDPRATSDAQRISVAAADDPELDRFPSSTVGQMGRGGMQTKIGAARLASRSGAHTVIASGHDAAIIGAVLDGQDRGSLLTAAMSPLTARKRWIANQLRARGALTVDTGAQGALERNSVSLLAVGVTAVSGSFRRGDMVQIQAEDGRVIAQGLVNYSDADVRRLLGVKSEDFADHIDYVGEPELVHRDNLVIL